MLRHRNIDRICCAVLAATILLTVCFMSAAAVGLVAGNGVIGYEVRLFDQSRIHTIDIVMDDWEAFLETCRSEEYTPCTVVIDGESFNNAAIRGKGNTSLSSVAQYGNNRYSFKIEFDQYQSGRNWHGLDKLSLNNLIQDKTCLKDYIAYTLMNRMGVAAPLCSFVQIRVNGEDWGFYLAVEGIEDSFLQRNYGSDHGELYKPDSMSFGGGRGNGMDFDMDAFAGMFSRNENVSETVEAERTESSTPESSDVSWSAGRQMRQSINSSDMPRSENAGSFGRGGFGMGSGDVMLQYIDDDPSSYSNIFDSAKTDITDADRMRLINSLKILSGGGDVESVVDRESVIRYFVVHNFMCNDDSYTGRMIHNYYLYEEDGVLSMIPWDYNLALGTFSMGGFGTDSGATSAVNTPIDTLVSSGDISSRPMAAWIFEDPAYIAMYHEVYAEFMATVFESGWFEAEMGSVIEMIAPFVQADENGFFTYEEFLTGTKSMMEFCTLRAESVAGQLNGTIPATVEGQRMDSSALIDASHIDLSDLGEFSMGGGRMGGGFDRSVMSGGESDFDLSKTFGGRASQQNGSGTQDESDTPEQASENDGAKPSQKKMMAGFDSSSMNGQIPSGFDPSFMNGQSPAGFDSSTVNGQTPEGFDASSSSVPGGFFPFNVQGSMPGSMAGVEPGEVDNISAQQTDTAAATESPETSANMTGSGELSAEAPSTAAGTVQGGMQFPGWGSFGEGWQAPDFGMDFGGMKTGSGANTQSQWTMLICSMVLLILAIVFAKFFKSNR